MSLRIDAMTYNICNVDRSVIEKGVIADSKKPDPKEVAEVETYLWPARAARVFSLIKKADPTFLACQELRNLQIGGTTRRLESDFYAELGPQGYNFEFGRFNGDEKSFILMTAHKTDQYYLTNTWRWWNNPENPQQFGDPFGGFGRIALMTKYYPVIVGEKGVRQPNYAGLPVYVLNIHPPLKHAERMTYHEVALSQSAKIINEAKEIMAIFLVMGDFNCFRSDQGAEELQLYEDEGFTNIEELKTPEGELVSGTFIGYPAYDKFVPKKGELGEHLDRVFVKVVGQPSSEDPLAITYDAVVDMGKYLQEETKEGTTITESLVSGAGEDLRRYFPSDHLPVQALISIEDPRQFNSGISLADLALK